MLKLLCFPFKFTFSIATFLLSICGRFLTILIGFIFSFLGLTLCVTVLGIFIGIPLTVLGLSLIVKGIF